MTKGPGILSESLSLYNPYEPLISQHRGRPQASCLLITDCTSTFMVQAVKAKPLRGSDGVEERVFKTLPDREEDVRATGIPVPD